jgi:hypothetical protein
MLLRDVEPGDVAAYLRMRCDPVMMAELGDPQPRDGIEDKVRRDAAELAGEVDTLFAGRTFRTNHWFIDPRADLS